MSRLVVSAVLTLALTACLFGERLDIMVRNTSSTGTTIEIVAGTNGEPVATRQIPAGGDLRFQAGVPEEWSLRVDGVAVIDSSSFTTGVGPILTIDVSPAGVTTGNTAEG